MTAMPENKSYYQFSREVLSLDVELAKGIAIDWKNNGNRIICDHKHACLLILDKDGALIRKIGQNRFQVPTDVVFRPDDGHMIVTDRRARTVQEFDRDGSFIQQFELDKNLEQSIPHNVAIDHISGNIVVSDRGEHQIYIFDKSGKIKNIFGSLGQDEGKLCDPRGIAVNNSGQIVVCDTMNHRLQLFTMDGEFLASIGSEGSGPGQLCLPSAVCIDQEGNYVVVDSGNRRVQVLSSSNGEKYECLYVCDAEQIQLPSGVALDRRDGSIIVSDLHSFLVFEPDPSRMTRSEA